MSILDYLPIIGNKGRKRRNGGMMANIKSLASKETLVNVAWITTGAITTPIASGVVKGLVNRGEKKIIPESGLLSSGFNILVALGLAGIAKVALKKSPNAAKYILYGALAGEVSNFTAEKILPKLGLGDFLTLPPSEGVGDFLTVPPSMQDFATTDSMREFN